MIKQISLFIFLLTISNLQSATITSVATGDWDSGATWDSGTIPTTIDDVVINGGFTVTATVTDTCASLAITAPGSNGTSQLTINTGITIRVQGNTTVTGGSNNSRDANLVINGTGVLTITGNITIDASANQRLSFDMSGGASTLNLAGSFTYVNAGSWDAGTASTINLNGTAAQTFPSSSGLGFNHVTLTNSSGSGVTIDADITSNIIGGDLRLQSGIFDNAGYAISGNTMGTSTFEVASGTTFKLLGSSTFPTFSAFDINSNSTVNYDGNGAQTIGAVNYGNLTSSNIGDRTLPDGSTVGVSGTFTLGSNSYTITGSTIDYNGTGSQNITAFNYNNLTSSSTGARTLPTSGTVRIAGTFTPGSNSWTVTSNAFEYNGTGTGMNAQTITAFDYNNLTSTGSGDRILASSGTVGILGTFTPGTNTYTITGSTIEFKGSGSQTIPAFNYNNLTSSSSGARTLASSGTIGIAATFTKGTNTYTVTGSTIDYNGSSAQTTIDFGYNKLTVTNTDVTLGAATTVPSDITISGTLKTGGFQLNITGDFTNNGTFTHENGKVVLDGSSAQQIGGSGTFTFYDLETNNSSGVTLNKAVTISNSLTLTSGKIATTSTNLLTFDVSATVSGGSTTNFINGPSAKNTNSTTAFTFPSGKNSTYMPLGIEPNNTNGTTFTAEYFDDTSSTATPTSPMGAGLAKVSYLEYYQLDRTGSGQKADARLTFYWDTNSQVNGSFLADLRVVHWDGSQWEDFGNSATTGDGTSGSVTSTTYVTSFSPFALGSSSFDNALPVELLYFKANVVNTYVELIWETATEINNDFFTIERSLNGVDYEVIAEVYGAGNTMTSQYYSLVDENPYKGISYYRLKQTDYDGQFEYFESRAVYVSNEDEFNIVSTITNPATEEVTINLIASDNDLVSIKIYDYSGKRINVEQFITTKGLNQLKLNLQGFANGMYFIHLRNRAGKRIVSKFVKMNSY